MNTIETRATFGVSFHPKMSSKKMTKLWFNEVTQEIRDKYPDLNDIMLTCQANDLAFDASQLTKEIKLDAKRLAEEAANAAAALAAGLVAYPLTIIDAINSVIDMEANINITANCKQAIHSEIDEILPDYIDN